MFFILRVVHRFFGWLFFFGIIFLGNTSFFILRERRCTNSLLLFMLWFSTHSAQLISLMLMVFLDRKGFAVLTHCPQFLKTLSTNSERTSRSLPESTRGMSLSRTCTSIQNVVTCVLNFFSCIVKSMKMQRERAWKARDSQVKYISECQRSHTQAKHDKVSSSKCRVSLYFFLFTFFVLKRRAREMKAMNHSISIITSRERERE